MEKTALTLIFILVSLILPGNNPRKSTDTQGETFVKLLFKMVLKIITVCFSTGVFEV